MASRRARGEGSIRKRTDRTNGGEVRWVATLELDWKDGKRQRKSIYGKTREEVSTTLKAAMKDRDRGLDVGAKAQTLEQFLQGWLNGRVKDLAPKTVRAYEQQVRLHIAPRLGRIQLQKLTPQHVEQLFASQTAGGLAPGSVRGTRAVLRAALRDAERLNLVDRNAAQLARPPRAVRTETKFLTLDQALRMLDVAQVDPAASRQVALYRLAVSLGPRLGEICGLRWEDLDLHAQPPQIRIRHGLQRVDGHLKLMPTKTYRSDRNIELPELVAEALREHRERQAFERRGAGAAWQESGHVFTTPVGAPLDPDNLRKAFKRLLVAAELPEIRFHDLRHSAASILLYAGVPMRVVSEILGHSTMAITADLYSHVVPAMQHDAATASDRVMARVAQ